MKALGEASQNIVDTVTQQARSNQISNAGLQPTDGKEISTYQQKAPEPESLLAIIYKLSTIRPYETQHRTPLEAKNALRVLGWTTYRADYDQAVYWITRLMAHYPRMDGSKAGIMTGDLARAVAENKISLMALTSVCQDTWQDTRDDNPWPPTSGGLLDRMKLRTRAYETMIRQWEKIANESRV